MDTDRNSLTQVTSPSSVISVMLSADTCHYAEGISMADTVLYEVSDGLATITLNRPEAMNALNIETKVALRDAVRSAAADEAVRAVLLTAAGERAFCVGQDLKEHIGLLAADRETGSGRTMSTVREHYNPIVRALAGAEKPVVAAVNGVAAGAGLGFALAADYRIVADTAAFNTSFAGVALTADSGISWTLPRVVGPGRAADLLLFPRSIGAQEAYELGIANRVVPAADLRAEAERTARALAEGPTVAYAALKEAMAYGLTHSLSQTLDKEDELQSRAGSSEDHAIAVRAFVDKEKPRYLGR
jgi:2-(1,2-epoxy-1,2-dihydrophenyl)acetyl-CoA isomerase